MSMAGNSNTNINGVDGCADVCHGIPNAILFEDSCTIVYTLTMANTFAGVALQIEDYFDNTSVTPMRSVSVQFLFYGFVPPTGCIILPAIIGDRLSNSE
jgi:hypothetical protein